MSFFCEKCDTPVHGEAVAAGVCNACLMGGEISYCDICAGPIRGEDADLTCESCQEALDNAIEDEDLYNQDFDDDDEEFLRGPF